jgi:hypothetical protein
MNQATTPSTLADAWAEQPAHAQTVERRRAYMAGALDALRLMQAGATRERLLAECVQFGRAIGTPAERASN